MASRAPCSRACPRSSGVRSSASGPSRPHVVRSLKKALVAMVKSQARGVCCPVESVEGAGGLEQCLLVELAGLRRGCGSGGRQSGRFRLVSGQHVVDGQLVCTRAPVACDYRNWRHLARRHAAGALWLVHTARPSPAVACASRAMRCLRLFEWLGASCLQCLCGWPSLGPSMQNLLRLGSRRGSPRATRQTIPMRIPSLPAVGGATSATWVIWVGDSQRLRRPCRLNRAAATTRKTSKQVRRITSSFRISANEGREDGP